MTGMIIGQKILLDRISGQIEKDRFPRFSILIGEKGSGKKEIAKHIGQMLGIGRWIAPDTKADTIRGIIETSYKAELPVLYIIPDCDNMSSASANALLKVTEEPPHNAYFILTCENEENLLSTIRSRGVIYMLEPYTYEDKCDYIDYQGSKNQRYFFEEDEKFVLEVASNIGEVELFMSAYDKDTHAITDFKEYVNLVIDNIADVSDSNSFKITSKINLKDEVDKFDLVLFLRAFNALCVDRMMGSEDPLRYANAVAITGDTLQELHIKGINKQMVVDRWIIAIREIWA